MDSKELEKMMMETHDKVIAMYTILCDVNGNEGLCSQFQNHITGDTKFRKIFYDFKLRVIIFAVVLVLGTGGTAFGIIGAVKKMLGS